MKKLLLVFALAAIIAAGTAFADHPGGLGIGVQGGVSGQWIGGTFGGGALSLKVPSLPIFWAVRFDISSGYTGLGISGDYYLIDDKLVPDIGLHWYLGVGGSLGLGFANDYVGLGVGARIPIGLSWQPIPLLEVFLQVVPSLGLNIVPNIGLGGGWGGDIGIRIWL